MIDKIKVLFNKKQLKIISLMFILLNLTGCSSSYIYTDKLLDTFERFQNWLIDVALWCAEILDVSVAYIMVMLQNLAMGSTYQEITDNLLSTLGDLGPIIKIVNYMTFAVVIAMFGKTIYDNYFKNADNRYAPTALELGKKVLSCMVLTYLMPWLIFTSFVVSTSVGVSLASGLMNEGGTINAGYKRIVELNEAGYHYSTLCYDAQIEAGSKVKKEEVDKIDMLIDTADANDDYDRFCGGMEKNKALNVYNALYNYDPIVGTVSVGEETMTHSAGSPLVAIARLAVRLITVLAVVGGIIASAKRVVDLFFILAFSWVYLGKYMADAPNENSMSSIWRNILGICMAQLSHVFVLALFYTYFSCSTGVAGLWNTSGMIGVLLVPALAIAWYSVVTGGPLILQDLIIGTGTITQMNGFRKGVGNITDEMKSRNSVSIPESKQE